MMVVHATSLYTYGNAIIEVHRPTLTDAERVTQEARILNTLQQYGKDNTKKENKHGIFNPYLHKNDGASA